MTAISVTFMILVYRVKGIQIKVNQRKGFIWQNPGKTRCGLPAAFSPVRTTWIVCSTPRGDGSSPERKFTTREAHSSLAVQKNNQELAMSTCCLSTGWALISRPCESWMVPHEPWVKIIDCLIWFKTGHSKGLAISSLELWERGQTFLWASVILSCPPGVLGSRLDHAPF